MGQHAGEALGVVAGKWVDVSLVGDRYGAVFVTCHEGVLGLDAGLEHQVAFSEGLQGPTQDHAWCVGPELTLDGRVALHCGHVGLPGELCVGGRVRNGDHVGAGGILAHRPRCEAGEPCTVGHEALEGAHRNKLGARLSVHLHVHGVDELDAVGFDLCPDVVECAHVIPLGNLCCEVRPGVDLSVLCHYYR